MAISMEVVHKRDHPSWPELGIAKLTP